MATPLMIGGLSLGPTAVPSVPAFSPILGPVTPSQPHVVPTPTAAPAATTTTTAVNAPPTNNTSSSTGHTPVTQQTIDAIMQSIANAITTNQNAFNSASHINATSDQQAAIDHANQIQGNQSSRAVAIQNAEQAAAQGNQGLRAVLASLGALNGTGQILAGRAVANSANNDIGGADKTYQDNATAIENANNTYHNSAAQRDATLQDTLDKDNKQARSTGLQSILNDAQSANDTATYQKFLPQLVESTAPSAPLLPATTTYNPATVNTFAPTSGLNVSTKATTASTTTPVNSALYVSKRSNS